MNDVGDISELRRDVAVTPFHGLWTKGGPVFSRLPDDAILGIEGRTVASFGDSATLGLWAFATGIWITGLFQSGVVSTQRFLLLFPNLLIYSGLVLFIAGLLSFRRNNKFLGSFFCSFAAFNLTRAVLWILQSQGVLPGSDTSPFLQGCLLESFAYIGLSLLFAAVRFNAVWALVLLCTFVGFALSGLPLVAETGGAWDEAARIGGYFMFGAGFFAYYGGTAMLVNSCWRRTVLPLGGQA